MGRRRRIASQFHQYAGQRADHRRTGRGRQSAVQFLKGRYVPAPGQPQGAFPGYQCIASPGITDRACLTAIQASIGIGVGVNPGVGDVTVHRNARQDVDAGLTPAQRCKRHRGTIAEAVADGSAGQAATDLDTAHVRVTAIQRITEYQGVAARTAQQSCGLCHTHKFIPLVTAIHDQA